MSIFSFLSASHASDFSNNYLPASTQSCSCYRISTILLVLRAMFLDRDSILHAGPLPDDLPLTPGCMLSFPAVAWIGLIPQLSQLQNSTDSRSTAISLQLYGHNDVCPFASFVAEPWICTAHARDGIGENRPPLGLQLQGTLAHKTRCRWFEIQ